MTTMMMQQLVRHLTMMMMTTTTATMMLWSIGVCRLLLSLSLPLMSLLVFLVVSPILPLPVLNGNDCNKKSWQLGRETTRAVRTNNNYDDSTVVVAGLLVAVWPLLHENSIHWLINWINRSTDCSFIWSIVRSIDQSIIRFVRLTVQLIVQSTVWSIVWSPFDQDRWITCWWQSWLIYTIAHIGLANGAPGMIQVGPTYIPIWCYQYLVDRALGSLRCRALRKARYGGVI